MKADKISGVAGRNAPMGSLVIVTIEFDSTDLAQRQAWADTVVAALESEPAPIPGLIGAHFLTSIYGNQVVNYAEWTSEQARIDSFDTGPAGIAPTDRQEWQRVNTFPGMTDNSQLKRYRHHRSAPPPARHRHDRRPPRSHRLGTDDVKAPATMTISMLEGAEAVARVTGSRDPLGVAANRLPYFLV